MRNDPQLLAALKERAAPSGLFRMEDRDGRALIRGIPGGETRAGTVNEKTFTSDAMVSTKDLDRYDTILEPDGWDLTNYQKNPVVFLNHCDDELPIGKSIAQEKQSAGLWARTLFAASVADCPDEAAEAWVMHRSGFMGAWSVSFWPSEWESFQTQQPDGSIVSGVRFTAMELLEYSLVGLPGNPNTITLGLARLALASATRFGRKIPNSKLPGDLGLISRAAQLAATDDDLANEILHPTTDPKFTARVAALKEAVRLLSPQQKSEPADEALAQVLARMREAGAVLKGR